METYESINPATFNILEIPESTKPGSDASQFGTLKLSISSVFASSLDDSARALKRIGKPKW